ncbi:MAG: outer membrane lipoprotein-sorting protein [Rhodospirillaceae bacterium]|nr:outer membrane lipoprotein-sorting protein [Rhodospirillaceae bacterium]
MSGASLFRRAFLRVAAAGVITAAYGRGFALAGDAVADLMTANYLATRVRSSQGLAAFKLVPPAGTERIRRVRSLSLLEANGVDSRRLTWFEGPPDVKGMGTLTVENAAGDDDIWVYLPAVRQTRRVQAANKGEAFLGTDFSYGDILGYRVAEWTHREIGRETVDGRETIIIESVAASPEIAARARHQRRAQWIEPASGIGYKVETFDSQGRKLKTFVMSDVRRVQDDPPRFQAMKAVAHNLVTNHRTEIVFDDFQAGLALSPDDFSVRALERGPR